jgi:hypothetical protein
MADNDYILSSSSSENENFDNEIIQTPKPLTKKKRGRTTKINKQKIANNSEILNQEVTIPESAQTSTSIIQTIPESTQTSTPIVPESTAQTPIPIIKSQTKVSWVWNYYIKKPNEKGEIRAYCQFIMDNGERCTKNYKYDGSTGNLSYHAVKHGIIPPIETIIPEVQKKSLYEYNQKEKEESTLRWMLLTTQPLSTVTQKAYIDHMNIIDSQFIVPGEKKIRMMIARSYGYNRNKLTQLLKTAKSISLTTDLWSSRSKHGYLGLTATWINQNFEIMDVLLEIIYFPTPHTAEAIANTIKSIIIKWEIENHVVSITTDNGANMIAAIRKLAPIKRFSCAAHTLQLAIGKGLKLVEVLTMHAKQLINFFSTQKQVERLIKIQKNTGYEEPLHLIQDISTR